MDLLLAAIEVLLVDLARYDQSFIILFSDAVELSIVRIVKQLEVQKFWISHLYDKLHGLIVALVLLAAAKDVLLVLLVLGCNQGFFDYLVFIIHIIYEIHI